MTDNYTPFGLETDTGTDPTKTQTAIPSAEPARPRALRERIGIPADSALPGWLSSLPEFARPYTALSRLDRPVGYWLLVIPCWIGIAFTRVPEGFHWIDLFWAAAFFIGAVAMRGAGCTWNDMADREIDKGVARTASRPLPSGQLKTWQAGLWLVLQLFVGFLVWLMLPRDAKIVAALAIPLVIAYPFMKRLTWWPQAWLGACMNWGVLVAAATVASVSLSSVLLWFGLAFWTIAYDTIYALQDRRDDEAIGVKSTARLFGQHAPIGALCFHLVAGGIIALSGLAIGAGRIASLTALIFIAHGIWQYVRIKASKEAAALDVFRSNVGAGSIVAAGFALAALLG